MANTNATSFLPPSLFFDSDALITFSILSWGGDSLHDYWFEVDLYWNRTANSLLMKYKLDICYSPYTFAYHNWAVIKKYINEAKNKKFKVGELFIWFFISNRFQSRSRTWMCTITVRFQNNSPSKTRIYIQFQFLF